MVVGLVTAALLAWIAIKITQGVGWVRWLEVATYVLGILSSLAFAVVTKEFFNSLPLLLQANIVVQFVLQTAGLILMFTSSSSRWFKARGILADS